MEDKILDLFNQIDNHTIFYNDLIEEYSLYKLEKVKTRKFKLALLAFYIYSKEDVIYSDDSAILPNMFEELEDMLCDYNPRINNKKYVEYNGIVYSDNRDKNGIKKYYNLINNDLVIHSENLLEILNNDKIIFSIDTSELNCEFVCLGKYICLVNNIDKIYFYHKKDDHYEVSIKIEDSYRRNYDFTDYSIFICDRCFIIIDTKEKMTIRKYSLNKYEMNISVSNNTILNLIEEINKLIFS